ncbi:hypothetical protein P3S67_016935 [Capsicum chacoense]
MLPAEKLNGENNAVKQENSESNEQDNGLINQEDMEKLEPEEQTSSETEVFNLSRKHPVFDETSHQRSNQSNPTKLYWPTEILTQILSRLQLKSLAIQECPIMEETNLDYHMKNSGMSCVLEGSVNGLICLVNEAKELILWNPAIRKYKKLPDFRTKLKDDGHCTYGFGYDDIHDDYKVVCIFSINCYPRNFEEINICKFVNGKLYWVTSIDIKSGWCITSFDFSNENWRKVERPYYGEEDKFLMLGVLKSNLSMIYNNSTTHVDVWTMKEYENNESLRKIFTINYSLYPMDYLFSHSFFLSKRGEFLLLDKIMIYNPKDNVSICLHINEFHYGLLTEFFPTLVCPLSQNEQGTLQD